MDPKLIENETLKVLCLEDSAADAELILRCLNKEGYSVNFTIVSQENEFVQSLTTDTFDIILSDYNLPGFSGLEALKIAQSMNLEIPYIFVSGIIGEDKAVDLLKNGASDYVVKSNLDKLPYAVSRALNEFKEKKARQNAEREAAQLLQAVEQSKVCVVITDLNGTIEYANKETTLVTGYTNEELLGKNPRFLSSGKNPKQVYTNLWKTITSGKQWHGEFLNKSKDGGLYWESANISPIFDNTGKIVQYLAVKENITGQKLAKTAMLESEERFRLLFNKAPISYQSLNPEGFITDVNITWLTMLGYSKNEVIGKWFGELLTPASKIKFGQLFPVKNDKDLHFVLEIIKKDGSLMTIVFNSNIVNSLTGHFKQSYCVLIDITDQRKSEQIINQQLRKLTAIYKASQRLQKILTLELLVNELLAVLKETLEFDFGGVFLIEGQHLIPFALREQIPTPKFNKDKHNSYQDSTLLIGEGIAGIAAKMSKSLRIGNVHEYPGYIEINPGVNSKLSVPLKVDDHTIGIINIESIKLDAFTESDQQLLEVVAAQITIAIQNARLLEQLLNELNERTRAEEELAAQSLKLEDTVKERTEKFRLANEDLKKEILNRTLVEKQLMVFQQMINSANQGFSLIKTNRRITYMNNKLLQMLEFDDWNPNQNFLLSAFISDESWNNKDGKIWTTILERKEWSGELTLKTKKGNKVPVLVSFFTLNDSLAKVETFAVIITDISHQKLVEKELTHAKEEAIEANQLKSTFLANMSHEIRTPMNAMLGYSELLSNSITDPIHRSYLESIRLSGKTLLNLINDILDLSKIEAGKLEISYEPVNFKSIVEEIVQLYDFRAKEKGIQLVHRISDQLPENCLLDELRVKQILMNLLSNAIKFTEHGYVRIAFEPINIKEKTTDIRLIVEDTGIGINEAFIEHLFEPFTQQDDQDTKKFGGTGLGLAITRRLVELMNGEVTIKSKLNRGSRFTVIFKQVEIVDWSIQKEIKTVLDPTSIKFKPAKILVVDDVDTNRKIIHEYLKVFHFEVFDASSGQQAIEMIKNNTFDLIFMDIRMPIMDGYETTTFIKEELKSFIPIVAITASAFKEDEAKIYQAGMEGYLRKPVQMAEIVETLCRFLPFTELQNPAANRVDSPNLTELEKENYRNALARIQKEVIPLWTQLKTIQPRNSVLQFLETLIQINNQYPVDSILQYTNSLKLAQDSFNIKELRELIAKFDVLITELEKTTK
ncbi:MAG: PAS domain S-box protein [Salinivirgaceae bacterium]